MKILALCLLLLLTEGGLANDISGEFDLQNASNWNEFKAAIERREEAEKTSGRAYMISGALLTLGGMIGYHNSQTGLEKFAYSVSQSLGIAGVGYGAFQFFVGLPQRSFYHAVEASPSLTLQNKNELAQNYVRSFKEDRARERTIQILTHSLIAGVNIYNGLREQGDLRQGLLVLGGIQALIAISLAFP